MLYKDVRGYIMTYTVGIRACEILRTFQQTERLLQDVGVGFKGLGV